MEKRYGTQAIHAAQMSAQNDAQMQARSQNEIYAQQAQQAQAIYQMGRGLSPSINPDCGWCLKKTVQSNGWCKNCGSVRTGPGVCTVPNAQQNQAPQVVEKRVEVLPSVEKLARALWESDVTVMGFVARVSDACLLTKDDIKYESERFKRAAQVAWDRDENGWRTKSIRQAERIIQILTMPSGGNDGDR